MAAQARTLLKWIFAVFLVGLLHGGMASPAVAQDDRAGDSALPTPAADQPSTTPDKTAPGSETQAANAPAPFRIEAAVGNALEPLFERLREAKATRATVNMLDDALINGVTINEENSVFQIASKAPDRFTIYLKQPQQRTRVYNDAKTLVAAMAPDAYVPLGKAISNQDAVTRIPVPLGPYPEPVLALTMAGVDPAISLAAGMIGLKIVDREPFGDDQKAIHFEGVQADGVKWDLWISDDTDPRPLRMLIDLTPMLIASGKIDVPVGYSQRVRYDFTAYRTRGDVDDSLFQYTPKAGARVFQSVGDYFQNLAAEETVHPMTDQTAPHFRAADLRGKIIDTRKNARELWVVDFWSSESKSSVEALPVMQRASKQLEPMGVTYFAVNSGETGDAVRKFLQSKKIRFNS
ncbi:MAG: DUF2092 domain-containing protein, partial [Planctomycetota bacterium]